LLFDHRLRDVIPSTLVFDLNRFTNATWQHVHHSDRSQRVEGIRDVPHASGTSSGASKPAIFQGLEYFP